VAPVRLTWLCRIQDCSSDICVSEEFGDRSRNFAIFEQESSKLLSPRFAAGAIVDSGQAHGRRHDLLDGRFADVMSAQLWGLRCLGWRHRTRSAAGRSLGVSGGHPGDTAVFLGGRGTQGRASGGHSSLGILLLFQSLVLSLSSLSVVRGMESGVKTSAGQRQRDGSRCLGGDMLRWGHTTMSCAEALVDTP
jgi:hypothetical protein